MGTIKYTCFNEFNGDDVEFFTELRTPDKEKWLTITYALGCNEDIKQEYTINITNHDVIGLIEFLKQQFNFDE